MKEKYCEILGVSPDADIATIKASYRKKAKLLHPDRNPSPDAHEQFVQLNEAYEYLLNPPVYYAEDLFAAEQKAREEARAKAAAYARMKYEEFTGSSFYREINAWETVVFHLYLLIVGMLVMGVLTAVTIATGPVGFLVFLLIIATLLSYLLRETNFSERVSIPDFFDSFLFLLTSKSMLGIVLTVIHFFLLIYCVFRTLIITEAIITIYIFAMTAAFFYQKKVNKKSYQESKLHIYIIAPFIVSLLFAFNYLFSFHPHEERLLFERDVNILYYPDAPRYNKYLTMRWFAKVEKAHYIHFTLCSGILGFDVIADYAFEEEWSGIEWSKID